MRLPSVIPGEVRDLPETVADAIALVDQSSLIIWPRDGQRIRLVKAVEVRLDWVRNVTCPEIVIR